MVNRFFIESSPDKPNDDQFVVFGMKWLTDQPEKALLYVPDANKLENSYLSKCYSPELGKEFRKKMSIKFGEKNINVITKTTIKPLLDLVNVFVCWGDDHYDNAIPKIEETYNINSILVFPWNPKTDIIDWKLKYNPIQLFIKKYSD